MHSCASQPGKTSISCRVFPLSCSLAVYYLSACSTTFPCSVFHQQLPSFFPSVFQHQLSQPAFFTQSSFDLFSRQVDFYRKFGVWAWMLARSFFSLDRFCLTVFSCLFLFLQNPLVLVQIDARSNWNSGQLVTFFQYWTWKPFKLEQVHGRAVRIVAEISEFFVRVVTLTGGARLLGYLSFITEE